MSRFLKYSSSVVFWIALLFHATSCCEYYLEPQQFIEFSILDKTGENVILANTLPTRVVRYYPKGAKSSALNPSADFDRGVFKMAIEPNTDYQIDIIDQSFALLELSFTQEDEKCGSYDRLSGVVINGTPWDYQSNPVLTLVYNP